MSLLLRSLCLTLGLLLKPATAWECPNCHTTNSEKSQYCPWTLSDSSRCGGTRPEVDPNHEPKPGNTSLTGGTWLCENESCAAHTNYLAQNNEARKKCAYCPFPGAGPWPRPSDAVQQTLIEKLKRAKMMEAEAKVLNPVRNPSPTLTRLLEGEDEAKQSEVPPEDEANDAKNEDMSQDAEPWFCGNKICEGHARVIKANVGKLRCAICNTERPSEASQKEMMQNRSRLLERAQKSTKSKPGNVIGSKGSNVTGQAAMREKRLARLERRMLKPQGQAAPGKDAPN